MRIQLVSDLHLNHEEDNGEAFLECIFPSGSKPDVEVLVIAGDWNSVWDYDLTESLFARVAGLYKNVLVVIGNHENWRTFDNPNITPDDVNRGLLRLQVKYKPVHVFTTPGLVTIEGVKFFGGTGWYPNPSGRVGVDQDFVDFRAVKASRSWFFKQHALFKNSLDVLANTLQSPAVVVSHHMPHPKSSDPQFLSSPYNHYFVQDMTSTIMKVKPDLWLHGHGHYPADYMIGGTRVVCNPRGYPFEWKKRPPYMPKIIEI